MQGGIRLILSNGNVLKNVVLCHVRVTHPTLRLFTSNLQESAPAAQMEEHGFESTTISHILESKGEGADGPWLWCTTDDTIYEAVKSMTQHNVGALVVVKPGGKLIVGIITEREYLRQSIVLGKLKSTKVRDIMTEESKLTTVTPDTKLLEAMQLMTANRIKHMPVVNNGEMLGMVSIGDVVRAIVNEHRIELDRLNTYIQGGY